MSETSETSEMDRRTFVRIGAAAGAFLSLGGCRAPGGDSGAGRDGAAGARSRAGSDLPDFALDEITIDEVHAGMRSGDYTCRSVTEMYLERIEALNRQGPRLFAVLETNPDALQIADQLDREFQASGPRGPLHGIPLLLKDNVDTADGMTTTAGSTALLGSIAPQDSFVAAGLRAAGALLLGKANMSEWAGWKSFEFGASGWSGRGWDGGRGGFCKNPYALDRTPGGSSSGSGSAVAANLAVAAIGSETDGSIVGPSSRNCLVGELEPVGEGRLQAPPRRIEQFADPLALGGGEPAAPLEPQVAGAVQLGALLALGPPHLVHRPVHEPLDVEAVEGDPGLRERLPRPLHVGRRHVHAEVPDAPGAPPVRLEVLPEQAHDRSGAARRRVQQPRTVQVGKQRDVVVAPPACRLVHGHRAHRREVRLRPRPSHMALQKPPQPRVVLARQAGHRPDRHLPRQGHHQRLEPQREAGARLRPRHLHLPHSAHRTPHPRHPRVQVGPVLEEVQVPPALRARVVRFAAPAPARAAVERPAGLEVQVQVQAAFRRVELRPPHPPRPLDPQRPLEQSTLRHAAASPDRSESPNRPRPVPETTGHVTDQHGHRRPPPPAPPLYRTSPTPNSEEPEKSRVFANEAFGYWKVTVERPLRLRVDLSEERRAAFSEACRDAGEEALANAVERVADTLGPGPHFDFNIFLEALKADMSGRRARLTAKRKKLLQSALAERDEAAEAVTKKVHRRGTAPDPIRGLYESRDGSKTRVVEYEPDTALRDTEQIPLQEEGGIEGFLRREVLPYAADAWYVAKSVKIGYEISFNRYFHKPEPMRTLAEIGDDILAVERETEGLLGGLLGRARSLVPTKPRVYVDTSVIGGCEDAEFREPSRRLIERCQDGEVTLVVSSDCAPAVPASSSATPRLQTAAEYPSRRPSSGSMSSRRVSLCSVCPRSAAALASAS